MPQVGTNYSDPESYFNNTDPVIYALDGDDFIRYTGNIGAYIEGGRGNDTIYSGDYSAIVYGGEGNDIIFGGFNPGFRGGGPGDTFHGGQGDDIIYSGGGHDTIFGDEGNDTIYGGDSISPSGFNNSYLDGGLGDDVIYGGTGFGIRILGGDGNDIIYARGASYVLGGLGSDIYEITFERTLIFEAEEPSVFDPLHQHRDNVYAYVDFTLPDNVENLIMIYGNQTYGYGNSQANLIFGNARGNVLEGRGGYDTLTGGAGSDLFLVNPNWGVDVITDFTAGAGSEDAVMFSSSIFSTFAQVIANARQVGTDTWIENGPGNVVVLQNVALSSLHQNDFGFI